MTFVNWDSAKRLAELSTVMLVGGLLIGAHSHARESTLTRLDLVNDAQVRGEILAEQSHRVIVDLGYTVLSIPRSEIRSIHREASSDADAAAIETHAFYRFGNRSQARMSIESNLARCAEAVMRVDTPLGSGSGFVIHPDGYVVTNHHVIAGELRIRLTLFERVASELRPVTFDEVRIVALDERLDLALLKIEASDGRALASVPLGDAADLGQGETVFSIGSPLGFDRTVSQGIISLKNRLIESQLYLQSTAQINPGNSGGPLFNLNGEVVGVNNMKIGAVGIEGLGFAIPTHTLRLFLDNADAFAFDTTNPNNGFRYNSPPGATGDDTL